MIQREAGVDPERNVIQSIKMSASASSSRIPPLALYASLRSLVNTAAARNSKAGGSSSPLWLSALIDSVRNLDRPNGKEPLISGIEASLADLGSDGEERKESAKMLRNSGLDLVVTIDVDIDIDTNNNCKTQASQVSDSVKSFESQLSAISDLGDVVAHINCCNSWIIQKSNSSSRGLSNIDDTVHQILRGNEEQAALEYLLDVLPLSAQFLEDHSSIGRNGNETDIMGGSPHHLTGISHETTGTGRHIDGSVIGMLKHPDITRHLLEVVPPLRLTMDLSSWQDSCGYSWGSRNRNGGDDDEAEALALEIVPHVDLIRVLPWSLLSMMNENRSKQNYDAYLRTHMSLWEDVWTRKAARGVGQTFMVMHEDCGTAANRTMEAEYGGSSSCHENEYQMVLRGLEESALYVHECYDRWSSSSRNEKR